MARSKKVSIEDFEALDRSDVRLEYLDGEIYYPKPPSVVHQSIVTKLAVEMGLYFRGKESQLLVGPLNVIFQKGEEKHTVQPDLMILSNKSGFTENSFVGVPIVAIEVLSASTSAVDHIVKMDLYMRFGVQEYWIVSPKNHTVQVFTLENGVYGEPEFFVVNSVFKSKVFSDLELDLVNIFG